MKTVRVLFRKKSAILVEYMDGDIPIRVSLPADKVTEIASDKTAKVSDSALKAGIPYGVPWGMYIVETTIKIPGTRIEEELHKLGIWTVDDYKRNPGAIQGAIMAVTANIVRSIAQTVKEYSTKEV